MKSVLQVQDLTSELASCRSWYRDNVADALLEFLFVELWSKKENKSLKSHYVPGMEKLNCSIPAEESHQQREMKR